MFHGFKNKELNSRLVDKIYNKIINYLLIASSELEKDQKYKKKTIKNDENEISNNILQYLNDVDFRNKYKISEFLFEREVNENYETENKNPLGRVDFKVINRNTFKNPKAYTIVECKRLDGTSDLNKKYLDNGICRFIDDNPLYSSHYKRNIMFGFFVNNNMSELDFIKAMNILQKKKGTLIIKQEIEKTKDIFYSIYENNDVEIGLYHIFYNFSRVIT